MPPPELTLIVAATTRNMGIGRAGDLPWTGLKKEMAYFARVTKRTPSVDSPNPEVLPPPPAPKLSSLCFRTSRTLIRCLGAEAAKKCRRHGPQDVG
jgi:dihydrofolate reductase